MMEVKTKMKAVNLGKGLVNVELPLVFDENKAGDVIDMLGGQKSVDEAYCEGKRMELRFRPESHNSKPSRLDRVKTNDLLVRIVRKRKKVNSGETPTPDIFIVEVLGTIGITYQAKAMCDFQYLPLEKGPDGSLYNFAELLDIARIEEQTDMSSMDMPSFLPPIGFSRLEYPVDLQMKATIKPGGEFISRTRAKRKRNTVFHHFGEPVPMKPFLAAPKEYISKITLQRVQEKFEERPVWSKSELTYLFGQNSYVGLILPLVSYHQKLGPWRTLWIKFGYDPSKDVKAREYQALEYRLRKSCLIGTTSEFKYKSRREVQAPSKVKEVKKGARKETLISESEFLFTPGTIPALRQTCYQLMNIKIPDVQALLKATPLTTKCTEKHGWLKPGVDEKIRELIMREIMKTTGAVGASQEVLSESDEDDGEEAEEDLEMSDFSDADEDEDSEEDDDDYESFDPKKM
ncbi:general transcription factor 3C polypeptide 5-like [Artemia franciscana]|uniref:General transcription factor 3C polypeptide 5 n=1 Tax=Artemia franciscana TaxID=6661 RepID=A0AA88IFG9_ARTSF|nr:hypothetical protein QYM36_004695 [Artemia franciscana]